MRETEALLPIRPETVSIFPCSVTDEAAIKKVAESVGTWDVLILNAGYVSRGKVTEAPLSEWWRPFEVSHLLSCLTNLSIPDMDVI